MCEPGACSINLSAARRCTSPFSVSIGFWVARAKLLLSCLVWPVFKALYPGEDHRTLSQPHGYHGSEARPSGPPCTCFFAHKVFAKFFFLAAPQLPGLRRTAGLTDWKLMGKTGPQEWQWFSRWDEVPEAAHNRLRESMFARDDCATMHLDRCVRVSPHQQDTGGFFIAVLRKTAPISKKEKQQAASSNTAEPTESADAEKEGEGEGEGENEGKPQKVNKRNAYQPEEPFVFFNNKDILAELKCVHDAHVCGWRACMRRMPSDVRTPVRMSVGGGCVLYALHSRHRCLRNDILAELKCFKMRVPVCGWRACARCPLHVYFTVVSTSAFPCVSVCGVRVCMCVRVSIRVVSNSTVFFAIWRVLFARLPPAFLLSFVFSCSWSEEKD